MVLILHGKAELGAQVWSEVGNSTSLMHLFISTAVVIYYKKLFLLNVRNLLLVTISHKYHVRIVSAVSLLPH